MNFLKSFELVIVGAIASLSLSLVGCDWLNSPIRNEPYYGSPKPPPAPERPYFVVRFFRTDGKPLDHFTVFPIEPKDIGNTVWTLDGSHLAVRKLNDGERIFFGIDFGDQFEVAQLSVEKLSGPPANAPYFLNSGNDLRGSGRGPNQVPTRTVIIVGTSSVFIHGEF